jgi:hypothetical protein
MFEAQSSYNFRYCNSQKTTEDGLSRRRHVFIFINHHGRKYTVWADQFDDSIPFYAIKFFPSAYTKSKKMFTTLVNDGAVSRVVGTCFQIMLYLKEKDNAASFVYIAEPKRHRVYEFGLARTFSDIEYEYYETKIGEENIYAIIHRQIVTTHPNFFVEFDKLIEHYENRLGD